MRAEADQLGYPTLDTTSIKVEDAVDAVAKLFQE